MSMFRFIYDLTGAELVRKLLSSKVHKLKSFLVVCFFRTTHLSALGLWHFVYIFLSTETFRSMDALDSCHFSIIN